MKILFACSEAVPFSKTGGLGDVCGSLPAAIKKQWVGARVITPLYESVPKELRDQMTFVKAITVNLAWRKQYCGIYKARIDGVTYILLDNEYYFKRPNLYGYYDDCERFAFFSKAVLDVLPHIDYEPDVIHCNDWQTAMVPVYLKRLYFCDPFYSSMKAVFSIHNIQYQGRFGSEVVEDVLGLDSYEYDSGLLEQDGCVNLMKAAIQVSDAVVTVSPTYAQEIQTSPYGYGLDSLLRINADKLTGIINGINTREYDPASDPAIYRNYSADSLDDKVYNKLNLQMMTGLPQNENVPVIGMVSRLVSHKGLDLVCDCIDELLSRDIQLVILGKGDWKYEQLLSEAQKRYPSRLSFNLAFSNELAHNIYAGSDMFLMPSQSEPCGLSQMISLIYGTAPIVRETGGLRDTIVPYLAGGNGFVFAGYNTHDMLYVVDQALGVYADKKRWRELIAGGMKGDYSWKASAGRYISLYRGLTGKR